MTNCSSHSRIADLFVSAALVRVLNQFLLHPEQEYYQRELERMTGARLRQVQVELRRLESAGLIDSRRHGNRVYYKAAQTHPVFNDLKQVFIKTVSVGDALRQRASALAGTVELAFVFGSVARGDDRGDSDIGIAVVGDVSPREVMTLLADIGDDLRREINTAVYSVDEFVQKARQNHHFVGELIRAPKIWLIGGDDELQRLVG
jgi:predicted nucleotidyltransferase